MIETTFIALFDKMLLPNASPHVARMTGDPEFCYDEASRSGVMRWAVSRAHYGDLYTYISKYPDNAYEIIRQTLFQMTYTFACIQQRYPNFRHGDLHIGNILVGVGPYRGHSQYEFDGNVFLVPNMGAFSILWDFGFASIPGVIDNPDSVAQFHSRSDPSRPSLDLFVLVRWLFRGLKRDTRRKKLEEEINEIWGPYLLRLDNKSDVYSEPLPNTRISPAQMLASGFQLFAPFANRDVRAQDITHRYSSRLIEDVEVVRWNPDGYPVYNISLYYNFGAEYPPRPTSPGRAYYMQHAKRAVARDDRDSSMATLDRLYREEVDRSGTELATWAMQTTDAFIQDNTMITHSKIHVLFRALVIKRAREALNEDYFDVNIDNIEVAYALVQLSWD
jgi:hypothetical protein